ncbi:50S ribosomal protein L23 [Criibacterium bergeronii]|uniref:Large ribosomal subunit protein uL23 n=1 Tax=Criibacterium bergeronii TaxID=1871336 RepID=A0A371IMQ5_9FIRM|nr:50S ribosomal protein L23 [Criibacterium bergeronii]MBS6063880.1 50S ribosomal protein L23 [Peptostreptococcaceae bacterium]RDY21754.1 50S ribosomal protein L23 [Criibacterium bergeronii]
MIAYDIIKRPVISEKSMGMTGDKKYTFIVDKNADKLQIKAAIEEIFEVEVEKVNTMNYDGRKKRVGKYVGKTASFKKAIVQLSESSKEIEIFGA